MWRASAATPSTMPCTMVLATIAAVLSLASGVTGRALVDPAFPVCSVDRPCSAPDPHESIVFWRNDVRAATVTTGANGAFRVALSPGLYTVILPRRSRAGVTVMPARIRVARGVITRVVIRVDVGIR